MTTTETVRAFATAAPALREWADPGWAARRDEAIGIVGLALGLGAGSGLMIGWLGWPPPALTLARRPEILTALNRLDEAVMRRGTVDPLLKLLVAEVSSAAAGCRHCQAQTAFAAHSAGASDEKVAAVWEFETSPLFTEAERAALSLALAAGASPNETGAANNIV